MRLTLFASFLFSTTPALAGLLGQIDTFDDDLHGWQHGGNSPVPPQRVADGGPDGDGDAYMQVTSQGGGGAGSKMVVFNRDRWDVDIDGAGIGAFEMDLRNDSDAELTIRLAFDTDGGRRTMQHAVVLPANGDWTHATFPLGEVAGIRIGCSSSATT